MSRKLRFRPNVESLETRRLMAGDVGASDVTTNSQDGTSNTIMVGELHTMGIPRQTNDDEATDEFFSGHGTDGDRDAREKLINVYFNANDPL